MSKKEALELPEPIMRLLDGKDLDHKVGETILLITIGDEGWPHVAMLSVGEVVAVSSTQLLIALWRETTTSKNLSSRQKGLLVIVEGGAGYYVKIKASREGALTVQGSKLDTHTVSVQRVLVDQVDYAQLVSGIVFKLVHQDNVVERWNETVTALIGSHGHVGD